MNPMTWFMVKELTAAININATTLAIKQKQLKTLLPDSSWIGPPCREAGRRVLINQGKPRQSRMSKVLAPSALLMLIEPTPANKIMCIV